ncbi:MAG: two-component regulator propeller domain-containing protein, partial [Thermoanaerobaculia bacterium]|nr:two-component regulator propeller domain-containing protein [Thermoanaerobaculia bacterium]
MARVDGAKTRIQATCLDASGRAEVTRVFLLLRRHFPAGVRLLLLTSGFMLALLISMTPAQAQALDIGDPGQALTQYRIDRWQTEQGLPLNTVQCLLQTRDGYLWAGTGGGLTRFDGVRFRTFESSEVPELASRPIFGLMEDSQNTLWIGHSEGVILHENGRFRHVFGREVTDGRRVWAFSEAEDGSIWIATANGLVHWDERVIRIYQEDDGLPTRQLRTLAFDNRGVLWIGTTGGGLVSFDGNRFETFDSGNGFPHDEVRHVLADSGGSVWAATAGGGLVHLRDGSIEKTYTVADGLPTNQLVYLSLDDEGSLWIATWGEGLCRMREGRFDSISTEEGLAGGQLWSVHADMEGSIWVGTWVGGLNRLRDRDFLVLGSPEGLSNDNVRSVAHARDGAAWITTAGGGVNRIHEGRIETIGTAEGLPSDEASCIFEDRDGAI